MRSVTCDDWKTCCRELLDIVWNSEDAVPFREPVDNIEHPDYYQIIDTPMDLRCIKEDLHGDNYETPNDFANDMRLIFSNSRNYNTNKKSRVTILKFKLLHEIAIFEKKNHVVYLIACNAFYSL